ncbi:restriction endonuclease subunit S [Flavobacterium columnare]|uniref:restriction endonuclease subunit S n=1 Tax=Flavobacterium columnare TaxID=996 RepID=UPI0013D1EB24|nr:restriction endonuclease subunit S [Flavobacterium columnare]
MSNYLDWQNKILSDRKIVPLFYIADFSISPVDKIIKEEEEKVSLCNYTDVYKNKYITSDLEFMEGSASENEINRFQIQDGDILITKDSESWDDIGIPAMVVGNFENTTLCGYHLALMRPKKNLVNPKFVFYCFESKTHRTQLEIEATGVTRFGIPKDAIGKYKIPLPSLEQQNKIVDYLDREIAKIDALIEKKTKLIALLEEKKKAVINQVVTKGLDTTVAMKDSGIEWLGEIPEHWEVNKISRVFDSIGSGTTPTSSNLEYYQDGNHSWLITSDLNDSYIFETSKKITDAAVYDFSALKLFPSNSLVIAMYGATIGKTGLTKIECYTNQACCVISNSTKVHIRYAHFYFIAMKQNLVNLSNGGGQPNISQGIIRDFKIVYPNLIEQEKIINFLENKIEETDLTIQKIIKTINLLKEKRTAIISAAINGEIEL